HGRLVVKPGDAKIVKQRDGQHHSPNGGIRMLIPLLFNAWMSTFSLRVKIEKRAFLKNWCVVRDHQFRGRPALMGGSTRGGEFQ
ncbi:hypothetical protein, partial [Paeniglutamicibacter sulfureus]|uniref:hypothetical protein n=1 Tax=Paeniglutamicibacter sulfureus TaxID=43666 RepID=UPI0035E68E57